MSNVDVYVICEGATEQTFIREVLAPEMASRNIFLYPVLIGKPGHKGGDIRFERAKRDIEGFLKQRPDTYVSTMFDYFRIETAWPGNPTTKAGLTAIQKAERIERATREKIKDEFPDCNVGVRFIPYIEMHEFEAMLFSDTSILSDMIEVKQSVLDKILKECGEPEEINDEPNTSPSNRIIRLQKDYRKVAMGKTISEAIGISKIREECPHFNEWIKKLEKFSQK